MIHGVKEQGFLFTGALLIATGTQINEASAKIETQPAAAELK